jgi:hypothetical protein
MAQMRRRYHASFELMHRFGGWTVLAMFWVQIGLVNRYNQVKYGLARHIFCRTQPSG